MSLGMGSSVKASRVVLGLSIMVIWLVAGITIWYLRDLAISQTKVNLTNLNRALAAQTEVVFSSANTSLRNIRDWLESNPTADADALRAQMLREADGAPFLREISVYSPDGTLLQLTYQTLPESPVNFADRPWFQQAAKTVSRDMIIADPVKSKLNNSWLVPLVARLGQPDAFRGAVTGSLDPAFFQTMFADLDLGEGSAITLQRGDSTVLARQPHKEESVGKTFPGPIFQALSGKVEALIQARSIIDSTDRLISGRMVGTYPLYVAISTTERAALAGWRIQSMVVIAATLALTALVATQGLTLARLQRENLARQNAEHDLRDKVLALNRATQQLESQAAELGRSNSELEQFAYVTSHDLRAPLRTISAYLTMIERRMGDSLVGDLREFLDFAINGAKHMDALILDLLDYARLGQQREEASPLSVTSSAEAVIANLAFAIEETGASIELDPDIPAVMARETELGRLLQNLLTNALKYRRTDGAPCIRISGNRQDGMVRISVADNGIGIDPALCPEVFGIFRRLHGPDQYQGTGIGLAIARKIVEGHGGRIEAHSDGPGQGTTFTFTLPAAT